MKLVCPHCKTEAARDDVDLGRELAFCVHCQKEFDCKEWIEAALVTPENLQHPPDGASYQKSQCGFKAIVSMGSYRWLFFLPFASFWTSLLLFFSYGCLRADPGVRWFLVLFLSPFWLLAAFSWISALMPIFGKTTIEVDGEFGTIFTGIGHIGWRRSFNWHSVEKIKLSTSSAVNDAREWITLDGNPTIAVAKGARHDRLCYLLIALRQNQRK